MDKLFKRLRARWWCVIFEMAAVAVLGGVAGLFSGGVGEIVWGAMIGAVVGTLVGMVLVVKYAPKPEVQGDAVLSVTSERL
jgi:hypothetical protein